MNQEKTSIDTREKKIILNIGITSVLYNSYILFYTLFSPVLVGIVSLLFFFNVVYNLSKVFKLQEIFFLSSVIFLPSSTVSILGSSYSSLPLTWHNITIILLILYILAERNISAKYFVPIILFCAYGAITSIFTPYPFDALKQILTITLFLCSFLIGEGNKRIACPSIIEAGWNMYFVAVLSVAIQIILQWIFLKETELVIGNYAVMGVGRRAYAGLMGDFSFASLFVASGILYLFLQFVFNKAIGILKFLFYEIIFLISTVITSSRTGIVVLTIILALYFLVNLKKINARHMFVLSLSVLTIPYAIYKIMAGRVGQSLFDSSGRIESYIKALKLFSNRMLCGYGFGLNNLLSRFGIGAPHNFFVQYLLQAGIIGTVLILWNIIAFVKADLGKITDDMKWMFWLIVLGSMLLPDIFSSRYLYVIVTLLMMTSHYNKNIKESENK